MMDEEKERLFRQYLDQELTDDQETEVLHLIAEDPEMRAMLHFERKFQRYGTNLAHAESFEVPKGFSKRVMLKLEKMNVNSQKTGLTDQLKNFWNFITQPRQIYLRPVLGFLALLLVLTFFFWPYTKLTTKNYSQNRNNLSSVTQVASNEKQVWTRFVYIDNDAKSVAISGDFNNWGTTALAKRKINGRQIWTGLIAMEKGEHHYMFVKNGKKWVTDPLAAVQQKDGFGNKNAVIYL